MIKEELVILEQLEEENGLNDKMLERKSDIQTKLMKIAEEEESYWHKRSNVNWLLKRDNNTEYFHIVGNGKKEKKYYLLPAA